MTSETALAPDRQPATVFPMNTAPDLRSQPEGFLDWYQALDSAFTPWQRQLKAARKQVLVASLMGQLPDHLPPSEATESEWKISLPEWCQDQRNQMTGPADDAELVVKMMNSGAPGVMVDLEDSMANAFQNTQDGLGNVDKALKSTLFYNDKRGSDVPIRDSKTVLMVRVRGLHLSQRLKGLDATFGRTKSATNLQGAASPNEDLTSASLYDVARVAYATDATELRHPLTFYIPKSENAAEAGWWSSLFKAIAQKKGWAPDSIKCFALVESHPLAYQIEEFLFGLRDHILGLNLGRWDYMASLIHFNLNDLKWVLPDRNTIPHDVEFFQNLRRLIPNICHRRGALAIGGMTALYPDRANPELNERALKVLAEDKKNEADCGMDGAWTGHPDQNGVAVEQFPAPNQLAVLPETARYPELRPSIAGVGLRTVAGTRAAVRTVIRYRNGVLNGRGASLLDGYMEDLATDRIYRLMIAQRIQHRDHVEVVDENGNAVVHTPELVSQLFDEELSKLLAEPKMMAAGTPETYREARAIGERMILNGEIDPA